MVDIYTGEETITMADRVPVFIGTNRFFLKKGLQSSDIGIDVPEESIYEQGNEYARGVQIQSPQVSTSFEELLVDIDVDMLMANAMPTISAASGYSALTSALVPFAVGPTDKINKVVVSYVSAGSVRVGAGAGVTTISTTTVTLSAAGDNVNFRVGNRVIIQQEASATNADASTVNTITNINGATITLSSNAPALSGAGIYMYNYDQSPVTQDNFVTNGHPNHSVKGIDIFCKTSMTAVDDNVHIATFPIVAAGTVTAIESASMKNNLVDILMLVNSYDDKLIKTVYLQDVALTSANFNFSTDGTAKRSIDASTGKQMDFIGYILRNAKCQFAEVVSGTAIALATGPIFKGTEAAVTIDTNTTFNELSFEKSFLKIETINSSGTKTVWTEVDPTTSPSDPLFLGTKKAFLSGTNIYFGTTLAANTRIELTYLCDPINVDSADEYIFDENAFSEKLQPVSIDGRYIPVTINTSDFDSRIDGVESSDFSLSMSRDFFGTQGKTSQRVKPAASLEITGSITSKEGFNQLYKVINFGENTALEALDQIDASKASVYTNTNSVPLRIRLYDPKDNLTEIATYTLPAIQITNVSKGNSVGSDSTFNFSFKEKKGKLEIRR
ncbi:MAG: hypothetical protein PHN69_02425 [Candidatus Pacebacteria bacterium]|nr:hypothetical protein [Candidatus Paceibacterota bacterium]